MKTMGGVALGLIALVIVGCSSIDSKNEVMPEKAELIAGNAERVHLYEVHRDGRIYFFYDKDLYSNFLKTGHTAYMFTRIGAGPNGESMVFALTGDDKKKRAGIPSVELVDGLKAPDMFYGETYNEGRLYVFSAYEMMEDYRKTGEAAYRFTDIGAGPNGETVVYVLSKGESKKKPDALIALFNKMQ